MSYSGGCSRDMSWRKWGEQQRRRFETAEQRSAVPAAESVPLTLTSEGCFKVAPLVHISDTAHTGRLPGARFNYRSKDYKLRIKWNCNRKLALLELGWGIGGSWMGAVQRELRKSFSSRLRESAHSSATLHHFTANPKLQSSLEDVKQNSDFRFFLPTQFWVVMPATKYQQTMSINLSVIGP